MSASGASTPTPSGLRSYADLKALGEEELKRRIDTALGQGQTPALNFYREELARREGARREERMLCMTRALMWLTTAIGAAMIIALGIALAAYLRP